MCFSLHFEKLGIWLPFSVTSIVLVLCNISMSMSVSIVVL